MSYDHLKTKSLFRCGNSVAYDFITSFEYPWQAVSALPQYIRELVSALPKDEYREVGELAFVSKGARVADGVSITGPAIICHGAELRHGAFIRGNVIVGAGAVVGNSTELKSCILFDGVQAPHFNYVGDSILGYKSHLGAGAITSNVKSDKTEIFIDTGSGKIPTGLKKLGAAVGDGAEIGCNAVLNPGAIIGAGAAVYPLSCVRGVVREQHIYKSKTHTVKKI